MGKAGYTIRRGEHYGGLSPAVFPLFRLGGLARSQISARIGARQSNRRGNLSRGVFPYSHADKADAQNACSKIGRNYSLLMGRQGRLCKYIKVDS